MPTLHEIAVSLTVKAEQLEAGFKKGSDASKRFEADIGVLQNRMGQTGTAGAKATATALSLEAGFLKAQGGAKRLEAEMVSLQKKLGEPGATRSAEATLKLEAAFLRAQGGAKRLEAEMVSLQHQQAALAGKTTATAAAITKSSTTMTNSVAAANPLVGQLKSLVLAYVSVQTAVHGVSAAFAASASVERQERAWKGIAGSVAGGRQEIEFVRTSADKLGVSFTSLEEGYRKIASSSKGTTLEGQASKQIFTDIALTMQALGSSSDDVAGAMRALSQMISTGVVQADELRNELGNSLPNVMGIAAKSTNRTVQEFRKLQETGGIITNDFLPNFAKMMRSTYVPATEAGAKVTLSLEQEAERAKNVLQQLAAIGLKETGVENWLKRVLAGLTEIGKEAVKSSERVNAMRAGDAERIKATVNEATGGVALSPKATAAAAQEVQRLEKQMETTVGAMRDLMRRQEEAIKAGLPFPEALTRALAQAEKAFLAAQAQRDAFLKTVPTLERKAAVPTPGEGPSFAAEQRALQEKDKSFKAAELAILKGVDAYGLTLLQMGTSALEIAEEKRKRLDEEMKKLFSANPGRVSSSVPPAVPGTPGTYTTTQIKAMIKAEAERQGVSPRLALAVAMQESYLNPNAVGDNGKSLGLFQMQRAAAIDAGIDPATRGQVENNIPGGVTYLRQKLAQSGGDIPGALRRYNGGGDPNYVANVYKQMATLPPEGFAGPGAALPGPASATASGGGVLQNKRDNLTAEITALKAAAELKKGLAEADETILQAQTEGYAQVAESMAAWLEKLQTGTDAQDADTRSVYAHNAALAASAGNTVELERNLAALGTVLDKSTVSTTAQERALILERMATVQGYEATKLLAQARVEDADTIEKQTKTHKDLTVELQAQQTVDDIVTRAHKDSADAIADLLETMKGGFPTIEEYEKALRKLQALGVKPGSGTFAIAENLKLQSTDAFKAIKKGAEDLADFLQSTLLSQLTPFTGGEAEDFGSRISVADDRVSRLEDRRDRLSEQLFERPEDKGLLEQLRRTDEALVSAKNHLKDFENASIEAAEKSASPWRKFGDTVVQEFAKIVMEGTKFREEMSKLLMKAGEALLKLIGGIAGGVNTSAGENLRGYGGPMGRAQGGPLDAGQEALVGEAGRELMLSGGRMRLVGLHGPEVVRTRDNAFVIPHQQTMTLLRGQRQLDNVVHTMARRAMGGSVNAGQEFLAGEAGVEGVVSRGGSRGARQGTTNITVNVQGVKDMQSFVQPRSQAEIQRAMATALRAAQGSL